MTLFQKVDQVLAALGNIRAMEPLHVDTFTEDKINNIPGDKIAESKEGIIYIKIDVLYGYAFLETTILSRLNIKTFKGAALHFTGESDFSLSSDTKEIGSDYSNVSNQYITKVSFDISEKEIKYIKEKYFDKVVFKFKKKSLTLLKLV